MSLPFAKMHGLGNNYIYVDLTHTPPDTLDLPALARRVSDVNFGVGSDGLIAILPGRTGHFTMRMFNADGSEAQMCGNGIRCVGKYIYDHGLSKERRLLIDTGAGVRTVELEVHAGRAVRARVDMGPPILEPKEIPFISDQPAPIVNECLDVGDQTFTIAAVSMGNPHCVIFCDQLTDELVLGVGPHIERHERFPQRTNVEFVQILDGGRLRMRVWERGSGETMACGTGACAVGVAAILKGIARYEVTVELLGGELYVEWPQGRSVYMTGPATEVLVGEFTNEWLSGDR